MKLFEYAVIFHHITTKEQAERGEKGKSAIIVDVQRVLANDAQQATMLAARAIPADFADRLDRVEIAVRPF